jgi:hypothetical protein
MSKEAKKSPQNAVVGVKSATPAQLLRARYASSKSARNLKQQQAHRQMQQNGSISIPNPWYLGPKKRHGSLTLLNSSS